MGIDGKNDDFEEQNDDGEPAEPEDDSSFERDYEKYRAERLERDAREDELTRQLQELLSPFTVLLATIDAEPDLQRKQSLLADFETKFGELLQSNEFFYQDTSLQDLPRRRIDLNNLRTRGSDDDILYSNGNDEIGAYYEITEILDALEKIEIEIASMEFEVQFPLMIGTVDKEELELQKRIYGAKGANLEIARNVIGKLKESKVAPIMEYIEVVIPDFERIPVEVYRKWKRGESITDDLKPFFDWIKGRCVMVRSSAVFSEDGDENTGAGIYESTKLDAGKSLEDFERSVVAVYESVDSDNAKKYRAERGITEEEEMGIVLHEFVDSCPENGDKGYVNSVVKQVPALMDISLDNGMRPVINRNELRKKIYRSSLDDVKFLHYMPDLERYGTGFKKSFIRPVGSVSLLTYLLEQHYGQPVQVEFVFSEGEESYSALSRRINLLQVRSLPKNFMEPAHVEFPLDKSPLFEGRALGIIDATLPVLPNDDDNSKNTGIVFFESSQFTSIRFNGDNLPQQGVVVVLGSSTEAHGHIETLCAERGLNLIFNKDTKSTFSSDLEIASTLKPSTLIYQILSKSDSASAAIEQEQLVNRMLTLGSISGGSNIDEFRGHKFVHVVSDGLTGKIYAPDEE
jgi:hypothetical protein